MRSPVQIRILASRVFALLLLLPVLVASQNRFPISIGENKKDWQRIISAADSNIDVGTSSLVLEPNGLFRAQFRTILSKSEEAFEKPGVKYKTRLETIQFDSRKYVYRVVETTLLDSSEKPVFTFAPKTDLWKVVGRTAAKFYGAAAGLPPLGSWRITGIRYADGKPASSEDDAQFAILYGSDITVRLERFGIGREVCSAPRYESESLSDAEFAKWTSRSLKDVGFTGEKIDALKIRCDQQGGSSELHFLFPGSAETATLMSGGALFDLEKLKY